MIEDLKYRFTRFMQGRYGVDNLYRFTFVVVLVISVVNMFIRSYLLWLTESILLAWTLRRFLSRNIYKRQQENAKYLKISKKVTQFFKRQLNRVKYRKTKVYKKCPNCKNILCLPKKKGRHTVKCPSCSHRFDIKI
jgi:hypothetical protein